MTSSIRKAVVHFGSAVVALIVLGADQKVSAIELLIADEANHLRLLETSTGNSAPLAKSPGRIRLLSRDYKSGNYYLFDGDASVAYRFDTTSRRLDPVMEELELRRSVSELPQIVASSIIGDLLLTVRRTGLSGLRVFEARVNGSGGLGELKHMEAGTKNVLPFGVSCDIVQDGSNAMLYSLCATKEGRVQLWRLKLDQGVYSSKAELLADLGERGVADQVVVASDGSVWVGKSGTSIIFKLSGDKKSTEMAVTLNNGVRMVDMAAWSEATEGNEMAATAKVDIRGVYLLAPAGGVIAAPGPAPTRPRGGTTPVSPVRPAVR